MPLHVQQLASGVGAPRMARAWVKDVLRTVSSPDRFSPNGIVDDLMLCASELVTLSLIAHSTAITLRMLVDPGVIRLSLLDDCAILTDSDDAAFHAQSMGLQVIEASSDSFGITASGQGRELWAQFRAREPAVPQKCHAKHSRANNRACRVASD